jgi:hypothetical protein
VKLDTLVIAASADPDPWRVVLVVALICSGLSAAGYRAYRFTRGGPRADAIGGAVLALLLVLVAAGVGADLSWARWVALVYGLVFGILVTPVWILGVYIPSRPEPLDHALTGLYLLSLVTTIVAALAL